MQYAPQLSLWALSTPDVGMTGVWTTVPPSTSGPSARFGHYACLLQNTILVFGGVFQDAQGAITPLGDTWEYQLSSGLWVERGGSIPTPRWGFAAASSVCVDGGIEGGGR